MKTIRYSYSIIRILMENKSLFCHVIRAKLLYNAMNLCDAVLL